MGTYKPNICTTHLPTGEEPIAWQRPIVMNTREEVRIAFEEFHNGTFVKRS